jgi:hypothetical protein
MDAEPQLARRLQAIGIEEEPLVTRLTAKQKREEFGRNDVYTLSLWVEVEGEEVSVKSQEVGDVKAEGWFVAERGKVRTPTLYLTMS